MRILGPDQVAQIEQLLGRPLALDECAEFSTLLEVSSQVTAVARRIATDSRMLAVKYLMELVPGTRLSVVTTFVEDVLEGGMSPIDWASRNAIGD